MRYRIVQQANGWYEGMDRPRLGTVPGISGDVLIRGLSLEDVPPEKAQDAFSAYMDDLLVGGSTGLDLLALGDVADSGSDTWEFLGYDVGETTPAAWSAIVNGHIFLGPAEQVEWRSRLNAHGLFANQQDADAYLSRYFHSDDPDRGWTEGGWRERPDFYKVIPVYRYRRRNEDRRSDR